MRLFSKAAGPASRGIRTLVVEDSAVSCLRALILRVRFVKSLERVELGDFRKILIGDEAQVC